MNKKGFTLIEMLVVIAIIAVLVAIVIPTVTSATTKAQAASNAANLRSVKAAISIDYLAGDFEPSVTAGSTTVSNAGDYWADVTFKDVDSKGTTVALAFEDEEFTITLGGKTIADWSSYAEDAEWPDAE